MATDPERITELLAWNAPIAQSVILSALSHNDVDMREYILSRLTSEHFSITFDREIFEAMQVQITNKGEVNIEQIRRAFKEPYLDDKEKNEDWLHHIDATIDHITAIEPTIEQVELATALLVKHLELRHNWPMRKKPSSDQS